MWSPLDVRNLISESGLARSSANQGHDREFIFGTSTCQVEAKSVPVAENQFGQGDSII